MNELGDFLQARRARVSPADRGLSSEGRRRVQGLRREEVALLAGVSVDYYVRLEQGRADGPSDSVLGAIARVLGLDDVGRAHLVRLARPRRDADDMPRQAVRPEVRSLVDTMPGPALVAGRWQEVLYANPLGEALLPARYPGPTRNGIRHVFLSPDALDYYRDWDEVAADAVASLRHESGRHPGDPVLARLVGELSVASPAFARLWARHDVQVKTRGTKRLRHPAVGAIQLHYETLALPGDDDQVVVAYSPADTPTADAIALLGSLTAPADASGRPSRTAAEAESTKEIEP